MSKENIITELYVLLENKFYVSRELLTQDNLNVPLTSEPYKMDAILLTYFYYEVCKRFGVAILYDDLIDYKFISLESISTLLSSYKLRI